MGNKEPINFHASHKISLYSWLIFLLSVIWGKVEYELVQISTKFDQNTRPQSPNLLRISRRICDILSKNEKLLSSDATESMDDDTSQKSTHIHTNTKLDDFIMFNFFAVLMRNVSDEQYLRSRRRIISKEENIFIVFEI